MVDEFNRESLADMVHHSIVEGLDDDPLDVVVGDGPRFAGARLVMQPAEADSAKRFRHLPTVVG